MTRIDLIVNRLKDAAFVVEETAQKGFFDYVSECGTSDFPEFAFSVTNPGTKNVSYLVGLSRDRPHIVDLVVVGPDSKDILTLIETMPDLDE